MFWSGFVPLGFPWFEGVWARMNSDLELMRYALENGCPADERDLEFAADHGWGPWAEIYSEWGCIILV